MEVGGLVLRSVVYAVGRGEGAETVVLVRGIAEMEMCLRARLREFESVRPRALKMVHVAVDIVVGLVHAGCAIKRPKQAIYSH